ncbi:branched-chain amino acid ABC transporter permease [Clostridium bovifaecis]|uniref:Branched-chain amino acid ABC transporter permease n=1 Tax=Clostridium bovifaecis TaxID=2184719 RepID=A0A6I6EWK1_9CLOT|nr:branched-chain amino acid ABC transporter permease [Clostridium bovifaecis]
MIKKHSKSLIFLLVIIFVPLIMELAGSPIASSKMTLIQMACMYAIVAIGYNILLGFGGQISLGHAAFMGLGAYITGKLMLSLEMNFIFAIIIAAVVNGILGLLLGLPALRLEGQYLAIATLGFGVAMLKVFEELEVLTGGHSGLTGIPAAELFGFVFKSKLSKYYLVLFFLVASIIAAKNILKTKTGRALTAMRDSEIAASSMGVNIAKYKTTAFIISAIYASIAGSMIAIIDRQVFSNVFGISTSLNLLAMIVIGGIASIPGSIIGAFFITLIPEYLKAIPITNAAYILTGVMLIIAVMFFPHGIIEVYEKIKSKLFSKKGNVNATRKEGA